LIHDTFVKITTQQYAKALHEATKGKSQSEVGSVISNFVRVLDKNNQLKLGKNIIKKFGEIYNQKNGIIEAEITSREGINDELRSMLRNNLRTRYGAEEVVLDEKIDGSIKGGIVIRVGD